jgi:hypothetical protein
MWQIAIPSVRPGQALQIYDLGILRFARDAKFSIMWTGAFRAPTSNLDSHHHQVGDPLTNQMIPIEIPMSEMGRWATNNILASKLLFCLCLLLRRSLHLYFTHIALVQII